MRHKSTALWDSNDTVANGVIVSHYTEDTWKHARSQNNRVKS